MDGIGLLERYHPALVQEVLEIGETENPMADQFATAFLSMLTSATLQGYEEACSN